MTFLVIRVRGGIGVDRRIKDTMDHLNLTRVNHAVLIPESDAYRGMLQKAKDYITWGEIGAEGIASLIRDRGRMPGNESIEDSTVADGSDHADIDSFAAAIAAGEATVKDLPGMKPVFRLHPPRGAKGWGGIKRAYSVGGALGFRGDAIEELAARMI